MKKELYKETGYPGIKQRISDNKYIVVIDYGRQMRMNPKHVRRILIKGIFIFI